VYKISKNKTILALIAFVCSLMFFIPEQLIIPVKKASKLDWHKDTFWYEPWGKSGVHKGIDIFAAKGTELISASNGLILYTGELKLGGKVIIVLSPKFRLHYYAHLDDISTTTFSFVTSGQQIGQVGDSGNAKGKPAHLHYSIVTLLPHIWLIDSESQGWKKAFYLDPNRLLIKGS